MSNESEYIKRVLSLESTAMEKTTKKTLYEFLSHSKYDQLEGFGMCKGQMSPIQLQIDNVRIMLALSEIALR